MAEAYVKGQAVPRDAAIAAAARLLASSTLPVIAGLAADVAGLGDRFVAGGNPKLEGDAAAAVFLAQAAARAAARLVELNVAQGNLEGDWRDRAVVHVARAEAPRRAAG